MFKDDQQKLGKRSANYSRKSKEICSKFLSESIPVVVAVVVVVEEADFVLVDLNFLKV